MKLNFTWGCSSALLLALLSTELEAQETNEIDMLRQQLRQATESFEKAVQEQQKIIQDLQQRLKDMETKAATGPTNTAAAGSPPAKAEFVTEASPAAAGTTWRPSDPIRVGRGQAYMDVGMVATFAAGGSTAKDIEGNLEPGGHDPNQRGFTVQGVEATFSGAVDPFFRGLSTVTFLIDAEGETSTELEEAYLESVALPANVQIRGGQFFTEFGRHNPTHLHTWGFVDTPLAHGRLLGPDGLRNPGARLSWLAPTPFYSELFFSVQDSHGETAAGFRGGEGHHEEEEGGPPFAYRESENDRGVGSFDDLLLSPRYAMSFDLTDQQVLLVGGSAAFGPNSSGEEGAGSTETQIYGVDATWKWKPANQSGGFPFVAVQAEGLLRRYDSGRFNWDLDQNLAVDPGEIADPGTGLPAALRGERLVDYGLYSQVLYGFRKGWVAGMRFDYVTSDQAEYERAGLTLDGEALGRDSARATRWRLSPNLTWYPSEFSKIRLQYNYDNRKGIDEDHSVWLQFEFILGAHAAHKF